MYLNPHQKGCPWFSLTELLGAPNIKWCEETLCARISEPANTWSNLGYIFIGLLLTYLAFSHDEDKKLKQFGPIIFFMGGMSFTYHMSNFYLSQILDFVGMFLFVGWALGMNLIRLEKLKTKNLPYFYLIFMILMTSIVHLMYLEDLKFQFLIVISALLIIFTEVICQRKKRSHLGWFITSILLIMIAEGFSLTDLKHLWCHPERHGWFSQGHALWHWTASVAMLTIYFHYTQFTSRAELPK